jgi:hypothetical protein
MARYCLVVRADPIEGADTEYSEWYVNQHMGDVLDVPGFCSAQRFRFVPTDLVESSPQNYLSVYWIETDDLEAVTAEMKRRAGTEAMPLSDTSDASKVSFAFYEPITE